MNGDVLVIGAGPAGAAAAIVLARAGAAVTLVDQHRFPRDKVCGDALIPDALAALDRLGLAPRVLARARALPRVRVYAPNRRHVEVAGRLACLPRKSFDELLLSAAQEAGASFLAPLRLERFIEEDGRIRGAVLRNGADGIETTIRARLTLLATGAASAPLQLAGLCERKSPSGIAVRAYFRDEGLAREIDYLCIAFDRAIMPGYGWIFPCPDGIFNVGAGCFYDAKRRPVAGNVRQVFETFVNAFPLAQRLAASAEQVSELRGAPLRTSLKGARPARPGLLVIGEAAGTTYPFTGEGIGKAMESAMLAASMTSDWLGRGAPAAELSRAYALALKRRFAARFAAYEAAQRWLSYPSVWNFIAARARNGRFVKDQLAGVLGETGDPQTLFSLTGFARALLR